MSQIGTAAVVNGIIVDKFLIDNWPSAFSYCWVGIIEDKNIAYLVRDNLHKEGEVVFINERPENNIALITWDEENYLTHFFVNPQFRDIGIGYTFGIWIRTWMAVNKSIKILPPKKDNTTYRVRIFVEKWKKIYKEQD